MVDRKNKIYIVGQVTRMIHKKKDFKRPVNFDDSRRDDIEVHVIPYTINKHNHTHHYFVKGMAHVVVRFTDIMTHVNLSITDDEKMLTIPNTEVDLLQQEVNKLCKRNMTKKSSHVKKDQNVDDDGRRTLTINPEACINEDSTRRSKRKRTLIVHEFH